MITTRDAFDEFVQSNADKNGNYVGDHYALWQGATLAATLAERERCARLCDDENDFSMDMKNSKAATVCEHLADLIRGGK